MGWWNWPNLDRSNHSLTMNFELRNHPAQARHFATKQPLFDGDGKPVPLFPDQRALFFDGWQVAYAIPTADGKSCKVCYTLPEETLTAAVIEAGKKFVHENFLPVVGMHVIAPPPEPVEVYTEEYDEDDE